MFHRPRLPMNWDWELCICVKDTKILLMSSQLSIYLIQTSNEISTSSSVMCEITSLTRLHLICYIKSKVHILKAELLGFKQIFLLLKNLLLKSTDWRADFSGLILTDTQERNNLWIWRSASEVSSFVNQSVQYKTSGSCPSYIKWKWTALNRLAN